MKIFISQPMAGKTDEEIAKERADILSWAQDAYGEFQEIPMFEKVQLVGKSDVYCMGMSIQMLADADLVIFAPKWYQNRGCIIEHVVCKLYGKRYLELAQAKDGYRKMFESSGRN